ncbi:antitoxin Xre/MbcA/ParS toxin-binding domain-containing protein [Providencia hangzhouensis]
MIGLTTPVKGLGHLRPIELIATESGAIEVIDLIGRIEHGVFS